MCESKHFPKYRVYSKIGRIRDKKNKTKIKQFGKGGKNCYWKQIPRRGKSIALFDCETCLATKLKINTTCWFYNLFFRNACKDVGKAFCERPGSSTCSKMGTNLKQILEEPPIFIHEIYALLPRQSSHTSLSGSIKILQITKNSHLQLGELHMLLDNNSHQPWLLSLLHGPAMGVWWSQRTTNEQLLRIMLASTWSLIPCPPRNARKQETHGP